MKTSEAAHAGPLPAPSQRGGCTTPYLPGRTLAEIPASKLSGYLLSLSHPIGRTKARYFLSRGYRTEAPDRLARSLRQIARTGVVGATWSTPWGTKYIVHGVVEAPDGAPMSLATVWMGGESRVPVLVTAYPLKQGGS